MYRNSEKVYDVVALGELLIDFTENNISSQGNPLFEANPGGAPCNVLAMLQNLGKKTGFIGKVGEDQFGQMLKKAIEEVGIDSRGLILDPLVNTTLAFVHTADDGERDFSFYRKSGADVMLREEEVSSEMIARARIFHFGSLSMTDCGVEAATKKALETAKANQVLISFDPNLRPPLWSSLEKAEEKIRFGISQADILKVSEEELEFITKERNMDKGIRAIQKIKPMKIICVTCGKNGSVAFYKDKKIYVPGFIQEETIETTGAGDTFCACMINFLLDNDIENLSDEQIKKMLVFANGAASIITTRRGALRVMPSSREVKEFIGKRI